MSAGGYERQGVWGLGDMGAGECMGVGGVIGADKVWVQGAIGAGCMGARYGQEKKKGGGRSRI